MAPNGRRHKRARRQKELARADILLWGGVDKACAGPLATVLDIHGSSTRPITCTHTRRQAGSPAAGPAFALGGHCGYRAGPTVSPTRTLACAVADSFAGPVQVAPLRPPESQARTLLPNTCRGPPSHSR